MKAPFSLAPVVLVIGAAQTLAWASSYYLLAILADPIARDMGMSTNAVFAAFSCALLISGILGPRVGRTIDKIGGRTILLASNLFFAAGLALIAAASSWELVWFSWLLIGVAMGLGLRLGILGVPARMAQAAAPLMFGILIERLGTEAFAVSAGLGLATLGAFCLVEPSSERTTKNVAVNV